MVEAPCSSHCLSYCSNAASKSGSSVTATRQRKFSSGAPPLVAGGAGGVAAEHQPVIGLGAGSAAVCNPVKRTNQSTASASLVKIGTSRPATATRSAG